jgi:hypothetical protein
MHYGRMTSLVQGRNGPEPGRAEGNAMRINVLGPIEISGGGRDGRLAGPGQRALLAALALDHGRVAGVRPAGPDPSVPASSGGESWPAAVPFR